jgi:hypothetical protein
MRHTCVAAIGEEQRRVDSLDSRSSCLLLSTKRRSEESRGSPAADKLGQEEAVDSTLQIVVDVLRGDGGAMMLLARAYVHVGAATCGPGSGSGIEGPAKKNRPAKNQESRGPASQPVTGDLKLSVCTCTWYRYVVVAGRVFFLALLRSSAGAAALLQPAACAVPPRYYSIRHSSTTIFSRHITARHITPPLRHAPTTQHSS